MNIICLEAPLYINLGGLSETTVTYKDIKHDGKEIQKQHKLKKKQKLEKQGRKA